MYSGVFPVLVLILGPAVANESRRYHAFEQPVIDGGFFHKIANGEPAKANPNNNSGERIKDLFDRGPSIFSFNRFVSPLELKNLPYCKRPAKCEPMNSTMCMGTKLPYTSTSLDLVDGVDTQEQAQVQSSALF